MAEEGFKRKLTAILSADVIGYSRLMRDDEEATVRDIAARRVLITQIIQQHNGRVVDSPGDNILAEFASVVDAVNGAIKIQQEIKRSNTETPEDRRMEFRIGINLGDVIEEEERIYGDGVNIAARVEGLAAGGGIAISGIVYDSIKDKLSLGYQYLGEQDVKNIPEPVRIYRLLTEPADAGKMIGVEKPKSKKLRWVASGAVALIILAVGAFAIWNYYFRPRFEPASVEKMAFPLPEKPSIAVLPFDNLSGDPQQDYLADGFSENITTALSYLPQMFVIARNSSFTYKGKPVKVQQVSEELGVRYILEGSVIKSGEKIRITAQLIDALTGGHIWSERYDRDFNDFLSLLDEITLAITVELQVELTEGEKARIVTTDNFDAWRYVEKGKQFMLTSGDTKKAREFYEKALEIDPEYAGALTAKAWTHFWDARYGKSDSRGESFKRAVELAKKSVALDENQPSVHGLLVFIYLYQKHYDRAIEEGRKAIALDPNNADLRIWYGEVLYRSGIFKEAVQMCEEAMRLHPHAPLWYFGHMMNAYYWVQRYEESLSTAEQLIDLGKARNSKIVWWGYWGTARAKVRLGRVSEAQEDVNKLLELRPEYYLELDRRNTLYKPEIIAREHEDMRMAGFPEHPPIKLPDKPSIAVLPFDNMSGDPEQEYISDGITENIITILSKIHDLFVISRSSSFTYKGKPVKVQQVSRELGVRYVLEGSAQKSGNRVRVIAQLIDAIDDKHLWSERYDREFKDIFKLQDEIALDVAGALVMKLISGEGIRLSAKNMPDDIQFVEKLIKAQSYMSRLTKEDNIIAKQLLKELIDLEPEFYGPYADLAFVLYMDVSLGLSNSPRKSLTEASKLCKKAISLDETQDRPHSVLSIIYCFFRNYEKAIAEAERAIALNPNSASAYNFYGRALIYSGRPEEAIDYIKKGIRMDPLNRCNDQLGKAYRDAGHYEKALIEFKKCIKDKPNYLFHYSGLAFTYAFAGRYEEAREAWSEVLKLDPKMSLENMQMRCPYRPETCDRFADVMQKAGIN
jgi:adenylate cyclase